MSNVQVNGRTIAYELVNGQLQGYDVETGELVSTEKWATEASPPSSVWKYTRSMGELVCREIVRNNKTLTSIGELPGFPPYDVLARWKREHNDFRMAVEQAIKDRTEHYHDGVLKTIEELDGVTDSDENFVQAQKAKIDAYKWLSEVGDRGRFGKSEGKGGGSGAPLQIIIQTGIDRGAEVKVVEGTTCDPKETPVELP